MRETERPSSPHCMLEKAHAIKNVAQALWLEPQGTLRDFFPALGNNLMIVGA